MTDVTRILSAIEQGDRQAAEQLLPLVYDELRRLAAEKLAQERPGQTLQATALVHEAYIRLVDVEKGQHWDSRGHFFAAAAEAMRRIAAGGAPCPRNGLLRSAPSGSTSVRFSVSLRHAGSLRYSAAVCILYFLIDARLGGRLPTCGDRPLSPALLYGGVA